MNGKNKVPQARQPASARFVLTALLICLAAACAPEDGPVRTVADTPQDSTQPRRPNVVVILIDDARWDEFGAYGHPFVKTPHIDRLATEGAKFTNAFTPAPLCSPSRASILTGLYPHQHGIIDNTDRSPASHALDTFPARLQAAGYQTAFIGKWHMGNDETARPGFDYWVSMKGQGEAIDPELHENGFTRRIAGYVTDLLTDRAVGFIEAPRAAPFALFIAHKALHPNAMQHADGSVTAIGGGGFIAAERHQQMYLDEPLPRPASYGVSPAGKPALQRQIGDLPPLGRDTVTTDTSIRQRMQMLMAVDESTGRLLDALERRGTLDNTVFIVLSDHGYHYGEHGLGAERRLAYEQTIRIPLLIRYPSLIDPGTESQAMVLTTDLAPTLTELGSADSSGFRGQSLVPLLSGQTDELRDAFLIEYYSDIVFERMDHMGYKALRTDHHKLIVYTDLEGMDELYDLEQDPHEMTNRIADPAYAELLAGLRLELEASFLVQP